jgi:hypothetical protein
MFAFLSRRRRARRQASADAEVLIACYGRAPTSRRVGARVKPGKRLFFDGNRPPGHWDRVRVMIGRKMAGKWVFR